MTKVLFNIGQDTIYGVRGVETLVTAKAATRRISGDLLITRDQLRETGSKPFTIDLAPTGLGQAWIITVSPDNGDSFSGYYKVPAGNTVNFTDLVEVDPDTLEADQSPEPEWWAVANSTINSGKVVDDHLILTRNDGVEVDAGNVRGLPGRDGKDGDDGQRGMPGRDGYDGVDGLPGVDVESALIDADGFLIVTLSNGESFNTGHVVGSDGVDGTNGTDGAPGAPGAPGKDGAPGYVAYYNSKLFSDPPSAYAGGLSVTLQTINNSGWADLIPGASFVNIETFRHPSYSSSGVQIITGYQTNDDFLVIRKAGVGDVWRNPIFYTSKSYVDSKTWSAASIDRDVLDPARIQKVSSVADGLMLKEDKAKLDSLNSTWVQPKTMANLPDDFPLGVTTFIVGTAKGDWPGTYLQVTTIRSAGGRATQRIEKVSSSSDAPLDFYYRASQTLNAWGALKTITMVNV